METELCLAAKSCSLQLESRLADSCCLLGMEIDRSLTQHAPQQSSAHAHIHTSQTSNRIQNRNNVAVQLEKKLEKRSDHVALTTSPLREPRVCLGVYPSR